MISVNGVTIDDEAVAREMQHHPAATRDEAERGSTRALVVRELLLQRVRNLDIAGTDEEERIANLIDLETRAPEPTDEEVARYYRRNSLRFMTAPLYEAAHIFFPARDGDDLVRDQARARAEAVLAETKAEPGRFADLARAYSACSSKEQGGSLGQVTTGDTNPELERAMATMDEGAIALIASRHGYHVLRLDRRVAGKALELDRVKGWIADHLRKSSMRRAITQYLQLLAARARIEGVDLAEADSFLVQ